MCAGRKPGPAQTEPAPRPKGGLPLIVTEQAPPSAHPPPPFPPPHRRRSSFSSRNASQAISRSCFGFEYRHLCNETMKAPIFRCWPLGQVMHASYLLKCGRCCPHPFTTSRTAGAAPMNLRRPVIRDRLHVEESAATTTRTGSTTLNLHAPCCNRGSSAGARACNDTVYPQ